MRGDEPEALSSSPMDLPEIDPTDAAAALEAGEALFVDVRRPGDHAVARIPGSINPSDATIEEFVEENRETGNLFRNIGAAFAEPHEPLGRKPVLVQQRNVGAATQDTLDDR